MSIITLNYLRKKACLSAKHNYLNAILTTIDHFRSTKYIKNFTFSASKATFHVKQIQKQGYSIIPNFINLEICEQYRREIDSIIHKYPEYLHKNIDDQRVYGAEHISVKIKNFSLNPFIQKIASDYNHTETKTAFTLAAKLPFSLGNIGSGGGWHRDSCIRQFKAILYLSDVNQDNGPFQLISKSNNLIYKLLDSKKTEQPYMGYRYTNQQVEKIISKNPNRLMTFCAPAGTLILVDTSCIHRGKPIEKGERYALFNYYYPIGKINKELFDHFSPIIK